MSLSVTQRPEISYLADVARWNAARNPVIYKMVRQDYAYNQANDNGGFMQLQFTGVDLTADFNVGDSVYTTTHNWGTVTAVLFSGGDTLVTLDLSYTTSSAGVVNNLSTRLLYQVEVSVYSLANELLNDEPFAYTADSRGNLLIDISAVLKANLSDMIDADLTGSTEVFDDTPVYTGFYIKYTEVWIGSAEAETDDSSNQFYTTLSALQIPSANGGNLAIYSFPETKFLTRMTSPVMWRGWPFLLSAIISEDVAADVFLNVDSDDSSDADNTAPANYAGKQIIFDLNEILTDQSVDDTTVTILEDTSGEDPISETLTIELRDPCDNPIMLLARNQIGGCLQWLFDTNQFYTHVYADGTKAKRLKLFADDLTLNQWEALEDFFGLGDVYRNAIMEFTSSTNKTSSRIGKQVYVVDEDGNKIGVIVVPKANETQTYQIKHRFEIEIEYPELFV